MTYASSLKLYKLFQDVHWKSANHSFDQSYDLCDENYNALRTICLSTFNKYGGLPDARLAPARLLACWTSAQRSGSRHLWNQETKWTSAMSIAVIDEQYKPGSRTNTEEKQRCWDAIFWLSKFHFVQGSPGSPFNLQVLELLYTLLSELKHAWKALHATSLSASSKNA